MAFFTVSFNLIFKIDRKKIMSDREKKTKKKKKKRKIMSFFLFFNLYQVNDTWLINTDQ